LDQGEQDINRWTFSHSNSISGLADCLLESLTQVMTLPPIRDPLARIAKAQAIFAETRVLRNGLIFKAERDYA